MDEKTLKEIEERANRGHCPIVSGELQCSHLGEEWGCGYCDLRQTVIDRDALLAEVKRLKAELDAVTSNSPLVIPGELMMQGCSFQMINGTLYWKEKTENGEIRMKKVEEIKHEEKQESDLHKECTPQEKYEYLMAYDPYGERPAEE